MIGSTLRVLPQPCPISQTRSFLPYFFTRLRARIREVWWLSRVVGVDFKTVEYCVPSDPSSPAGKNFDWRMKLSSGVTLNLEVKRRIGDIGRAIDVEKFKWKSTFHDIDKFPDPQPPDRLNVACIRLFGSVSGPVRHSAHQWLRDTPRVSALAFHAVTQKPGESFALLSQPGLGYIEILFSPPDQEDEIYIAPFWFARDIPGLDLPRAR